MLGGDRVVSVHSPIHRIRVGATTVVALALSCVRDVPPESSPVKEAGARLEVDYAGCRSLWLEPELRCLFEPKTPLRLWVHRPAETEIAIRVDGEDWPTEVYHVDGMDGLGVEVALPPSATELTVELVGGCSSAWSLPLRSWADDSGPSGGRTSEHVDEALGKAFFVSASGRHGHALTLMRDVQELANRYPKGRADLATYRGVTYWRQGRYHDAASSLAEGVSFAIRLRDSELINDAIHVYVGVLAELGYWEATIEWSDEVLSLARDSPELIQCGALANVKSTVGYAHMILGRYRGESSPRARRLLEQALAGVGPTGECPEPWSVPSIVLSLADDALDRGAPVSALDAIGAVDFEFATDDVRVRLRDAELRALEQAGRPAAELGRSLSRLEDAVADAGLPEGRWRLALRRGDLRVRQERWEEAVGAYREAEVEAQRIAELAAVGVGRETAVTLHGQSTERLIRLLERLGRPGEALCVAREAQARRTQGEGNSLTTPRERREQLDRAIERYQEVRRRLDSATMASRDLPRSERNELRFAVAREERQLAGLANDILRAKSTWRPKCDELAPRRPGELLLGLYPSSAGWLVFVQSDTGTTLHLLEGGPSHALDDPALGSELLDPLEEYLVEASSVRVLASGRAQEVDVHGLLWNGAPLVVHVPVTYGVELPRSAPSVRPAGKGLKALLVADPTESLHEAPKEVLAIQSWLLARGWTVDVATPDEADPRHVLEGLTDVSFFYFAGHGEHDARSPGARALPPYAGGSRGWPDRLRLKPPTTLGIQDILMLPSAPTYVALFGCETGVAGRDQGMSLALAFLVAGARQVVATPEEVTDADAFATGVGLRDGLSTREVNLATGLRSAQIDLLRRGRPVGRYRVWVR